MSAEDALHYVTQSMMLVMLLSMPPIIVASIVGIVVSLLQALTQIQEQTLVFVPKILAIFATMLVALPFMGDLMNGVTARIMAKVVMGG